MAMAGCRGGNFEVPLRPSNGSIAITTAISHIKKQKEHRSGFMGIRRDRLNADPVLRPPPNWWLWIPIIISSARK